MNYFSSSINSDSFTLKEKETPLKKLNNFTQKSGENSLKLLKNSILNKKLTKDDNNNSNAGQMNSNLISYNKSNDNKLDLRGNKEVCENLDIKNLSHTKEITFTSK